ncbi:MAG: hypothetical protein V3R14_00475 [Nitrospinaceae bacterium]
MPPGKARLWSTVLLLGLLNSPALAQEPQQVRESAPKENTEMPSLELLEFLGDWETEDGEWIDPEELEQIAITDQEQEVEDEKQK